MITNGEQLGLKEFEGCRWLWYDHYGYDDVNVYMMARKEISLSKLPSKAEIKITADSRYKLYVNGNYICCGPARGYPERYPFDRVDIAPYSKKGKNVLAVLVHQFGRGTYQSLYAGAGGLLVSGRIGGVDAGTKRNSWLVKKCPGHKQDMANRTIQMGYQENFDARLVEPSWKLPGANIRDGKDGWSYADSYCRPAGCLPWLNFEEREIPLMREEIKNLREVRKVYLGDAYSDWEKARNLTEVYLKEESGVEIETHIRNKEAMLEPGFKFTEILPFPRNKRLTLILDFGEEVAGFLGIEAEGRGGEVVDFTTSELLGDGFLCVEEMKKSWCKIALTDRFVLRKGKNNLETFSIHGFRYLALTLRNVREKLKIYRIYVRQASYPFAERAIFQCSDEKLNKVWEMCLRTQLNCSLDAYVDCPWREQAQWWGDARVQGINTYYLFGDMRLLRRGIKQAGQSQIPNGLTYGHFPTAGVGCVLPDFTLTWIHTHLDFYNYSGDRSLLGEQFPRIKKALGFFQNYMKKRNLLGAMQEWWLFFDWAPLYREGYSAFFNLLYLSTLRQVVEICRILKKDGSQYQKEALLLESKIIRHFWSGKDKVFYDGFDLRKKRVVKRLSQHAHAFAILSGLKPDFHKKFCDEILIPPMKKHPLSDQNIIEATPFFYFYVLEALKKVGGYEQDIVDFIRRRWGKMLDEGATTCYEVWNPKPGETSLCHAWSAHPVVHLVNILAGLKPLAPDWRRFSINPNLLDIDWLNLKIPAFSGNIEIALKKEKAGIAVNLSVPPDSRGLFIHNGVKKVIRPGKYRFFTRQSS